VAEQGGREGIDRLAGRVIGSSARSHAVLPSPDLCVVGLELAGALTAYESEGGREHRVDVLGRDEFRPVVVRSRCRTALPRPQGRWEVALSDGTDDEWVIGEAGGGWLVEGLERLTGGTPRGAVVGVDERAPAAGPPRSRRRRVAVGWFIDPDERHDLRYFDGTTWTRFVLDADPGP
jgi:Protein of unknown function (DUF2510)